MSADRLWSLAPEERKGLTPHRVVEAAVALADADGLDAVSMARVAKALDVTPMALYRHVASKDELLVLMVDVAVGAPPALPARGDWRAQLEAWSRELLAVLRAHPWFLHIPLGWAALGPNRVGWLDAALAALADTPLSEEEKAATSLLLNNVVFSIARTEAETGRSIRGEHPADEFAATLARMTSDRFPAVRRAADAGVFSDGDGPEDALRFDLAVVLGGVERLIEARAAG